MPVPKSYLDGSVSSVVVHVNSFLSRAYFVERLTQSIEEHQL